VFIQPVVVAEDKSKITALFTTIPVGFEHLKAVNFEHLDYKDADLVFRARRKQGVAQVRPAQVK
jgi:hypothetical protein